jgi:transcriptional regulator with XRE-family HTH domain
MGHAKNRPKRLAEKLLQIRTALGLTQKEMAERLNEQAGVKITHRSVSKYERGKSVPYNEIVLAYARLANVDMSQIVDDDLDIEPTEWPEFIEL